MDPRSPRTSVQGRSPPSPEPTVPTALPCNTRGHACHTNSLQSMLLVTIYYIEYRTGYEMWQLFGGGFEVGLEKPGTRRSRRKGTSSAWFTTCYFAIV